MYVAYFAPYSRERHRDFMAQCLMSPRVRHEVLGETVLGDDIDLLVVSETGAPPSAGKKACWAIARQHPGETMAQWWMEGLLGRLIDPGDAAAAELLAKADFYVVPNMNPDGSQLGNLRTNAAGANLNREWETPSLEKSPEVYHVLRRMMESGVDFALDVHGDEGLPYVFLTGGDKVPSMDDRMRGVQAEFSAALVRANSDFQTEHGYPPAKTANLTLCANQVAERFGCFASTLEMPFKDNADAPDDSEGWSIARSRRMGEACLQALCDVVDDLR